MTSTALRWACAGLTGLVLAGCSTISDSRNCHNDPNCDGPAGWSDDWYASRAGEPVGERQEWKYGKAWPPFPRPAGEDAAFPHVYHAAKYWPWPYVCDDRAYVRTVSNLQTMQGWIVAATLYDYHFDPETQCLTPAGLLHLRWILECVPVDRRCAWVQTTLDPLISQHRLSHVREQAVLLVGEQNCPPVELRVCSPTGRPAAELDALRRAYMQTMPQPRIEYTPLPTGGGGATGS